MLKKVRKGMTSLFYVSLRTFYSNKYHSSYGFIRKMKEKMHWNWDETCDNKGALKINCLALN